MVVRRLGVEPDLGVPLQRSNFPGARSIIRSNPYRGSSMNESRIGKRLLTLIQGEVPTGVTARRGFFTAVAAGVVGAGARIT
jgi:hypothetical protein